MSDLDAMTPPPRTAPYGDYRKIAAFRISWPVMRQLAVMLLRGQKPMIEFCVVVKGTIYVDTLIVGITTVNS